MKSSKMALSVLNSVLGILIMVLILFVTLKAGEAAYNLGYRVFTEPSVDKEPGKDVTVRIQKGISATELGSLLEEKGLVDNGVLFSIQLYLSSFDDKLKSGDYVLNTSQTAEEMIQILAGEETEEAEE
ncbi:MAG: aminodeoxychorismate lyase [Lachnospiraceae bacterium]|jgi:cell division protein YceG involved in septum cleavage|nr:aminodeoxychorismate lyase [Lachnospiraceae bacterium]MCI8871824.1 aminodeoxychorismate lyase [Lachnospiraceae bacterium]MCI9059765.1 aminodeoxychorismate lyase [Lachnospiraceae bacterium]GFI31632.1 endolytic murein transglycosylase [Lachnospiraceae bacterium]